MVPEDERDEGLVFDTYLRFPSLVLAQVIVEFLVCIWCFSLTSYYFTLFLKKFSTYSPELSIFVYIQ